MTQTSRPVKIHMAIILILFCTSHTHTHSPHPPVPTTYALLIKHHVFFSVAWKTWWRGSAMFDTMFSWWCHRHQQGKAVTPRSSSWSQPDHCRHPGEGCVLLFPTILVSGWSGENRTRIWLVNHWTWQTELGTTRPQTAGYIIIKRLWYASFFTYFFGLAHHCGVFIQKHSSIITIFLSLTHSCIIFFKDKLERQICLHNEPNNTTVKTGQHIVNIGRTHTKQQHKHGRERPPKRRQWSAWHCKVH